MADDEENVRCGLARYISEHGKGVYKVYTAESGREALEVLIRVRPHVLIIDIQMPYKDGLQVIKEANQAGLYLKTIILSGYDKFNYAQQALRLGVVDYLLKPCRPNDLFAKLQKIVSIEDIQQDDADDKKENKNRLIDLAIEYINEHYAENLSLTLVAERVGLSPAYFSTLFTHTMDCSFVDYLNKIRVDRACSYLYSPYLKTYEVADKVGIKDEKYFSRIFKKITGMTPSQFRKDMNE